MFLIVSAWNIFLNISPRQVMSKYQALISSDAQGRLFLSDCGSSNGTFINNLRLSKPNKTSKEVQLFSQDVIRLGRRCVLP